MPYSFENFSAKLDVNTDNKLRPDQLEILKETLFSHLNNTFGFKCMSMVFSIVTELPVDLSIYSLEHLQLLNFNERLSLVLNYVDKYFLSKNKEFDQTQLIQVINRYFEPSDAMDVEKIGFDLLSQLPKELELQVLGYLSASQLASLRRVNRAYRDRIADRSVDLYCDSSSEASFTESYSQLKRLIPTAKYSRFERYFSQESTIFEYCKEEINNSEVLLTLLSDVFLSLKSGLVNPELISYCIKEHPDLLFKTPLSLINQYLPAAVKLNAELPTTLIGWLITTNNWDIVNRIVIVQMILNCFANPNEVLNVNTVYNKKEKYNLFITNLTSIIWSSTLAGNTNLFDTFHKLLANIKGPYYFLNNLYLGYHHEYYPSSIFDNLFVSKNIAKIISLIEDDGLDNIVPAESVEKSEGWIIKYMTLAMKNNCNYFLAYLLSRTNEFPIVARSAVIRKVFAEFISLYIAKIKDNCLDLDLIFFQQLYCEHKIKLDLHLKYKLSIIFDDKIDLNSDNIANLDEKCLLQVFELAFLSDISAAKRLKLFDLLNQTDVIETAKYTAIFNATVPSLQYAVQHDIYKKIFSTINKNNFLIVYFLDEFYKFYLTTDKFNSNQLQSYIRLYMATNELEPERIIFYSELLSQYWSHKEPDLKYSCETFLSILDSFTEFKNIVKYDYCDPGFNFLLCEFLLYLTHRINDQTVLDFLKEFFKSLNTEYVQSLMLVGIEDLVTPIDIASREQEFLREIQFTTSYFMSPAKNASSEILSNHAIIRDSVVSLPFLNYPVWLSLIPQYPDWLQHKSPKGNNIFHLLFMIISPETENKTYPRFRVSSSSAPPTRTTNKMFYSINGVEVIKALSGSINYIDYLTLMSTYNPVGVTPFKLIFGSSNSFFLNSAVFYLEFLEHYSINAIYSYAQDLPKLIWRGLTNEKNDGLDLEPSQANKILLKLLSNRTLYDCYQNDRLTLIKRLLHAFNIDYEAIRSAQITDSDGSNIYHLIFKNLSSLDRQGSVNKISLKNSLNIILEIIADDFQYLFELNAKGTSPLKLLMCNGHSFSLYFQDLLVVLLNKLGLEALFYPVDSEGMRLIDLGAEHVIHNLNSDHKQYQYSNIYNFLGVSMHRSSNDTNSAVNIKHLHFMVFLSLRLRSDKELVLNYSLAELRDYVFQAASSPANFLVNNQNYLHKLFSDKNIAISSVKSVFDFCRKSFFPKQQFIQMLLAKDSAGNTPLHLCLDNYSSSYSIFHIIKSLSFWLTPSNFSRLANTTNNSGKRLVYICTYVRGKERTDKQRAAVRKNQEYFNQTMQLLSVRRSPVVCVGIRSATSAASTQNTLAVSQAMQTVGCKRGRTIPELEIIEIPRRDQQDNNEHQNKRLKLE